jgi:DNA (cytosine-5)-methyltransferase 1
MVRLFECFAGYGTASFALKQLGIDHELVGWSEIEPAAIKCFKRNHCSESLLDDWYVPLNFGDITKIDWNSVPDFDLLTGGFPCQSFSTAGKGLGDKDYRGQLGLELTKALKVKQPKYFLFENVKGFMNGKFNEFGSFLVNSWKDAGYRVEYRVLNTCDFGVPQNRERVWFVGVRKDLPVRFFNWPVKKDLLLTLGDLLEDSVEDKYWLKEHKVEKIYENLGKLNRESAFFTQPMNESWVSKTVTCSGEKVVQQFGKYRYLTPKEFFRLQGFLQDEVNLEGLTDRQAYKLAGNGQSVNVVKLLFKELLKDEM